MPKSKIILFDADTMVGEKTGIGHYTEKLIEGMSDIAGDDVEFVGHYFNFLGLSKNNLPVKKNITYTPSKLMPRKLFNALRRVGIHIPVELLVRRKADFMIFSNYLRKRSLFGTPYLCVVHDLTYIEKPEYVAKRNLKDLVRFMPDTLRNATLIFTISNATRNSIEKYYGYINTPVFVEHIPPISRERNYPVRPSNLSYLKHKKYILFIGTLEPRKNINGLLSAYEETSYLNQNYSLVLVGKNGWNNTEITKKISRLKNNGLDLITTGYVSEDEKAWLYKHARIVVVPSFYEGYGMQLVEAAHHRVPLAVSDIPVFREVIKGGAVYFNPNNSRNIGEILSSTLSDKSAIDTLKKNQEKVIKKLSWNKVASSFYSKVDHFI